MAVNIKFLADVVDLIRGLGQSREAVEDNAEALEDVAKQAIELGLQMGKTTDEIARDWTEASGIPFDRTKRAVEEVERATRDLEDAQGDAADAAEDAARKTGDAAEDAARKTGTIKDKASEVAGAFPELGSIVRDVLAGDFGSAAESAIGSLSGLAAAAGIGGAAGGLILEAVGGLAGALIKEWQRFPENVKATKDELVNALLQAGGAFDEAEIESRLRAVASDSEKWRDAQLIVAATGRDLGDVVATLAGVTDDADAVLKDWNKSWGDLPGNIPLAELDHVGSSLRGLTEAGGTFAEKQAAVNGAMQRTKRDAEDAASGVKSLWDQVKNPPMDPAVKVSVDTSRAERDLALFKQRVAGTTIRVKASIVAPDGTRLLE